MMISIIGRRIEPEMDICTMIESNNSGNEPAYPGKFPQNMALNWQDKLIGVSKRDKTKAPELNRADSPEEPKILQSERTHIVRELKKKIQKSRRSNKSRDNSKYTNSYNTRGETGLSGIRPPKHQKRNKNQDHQKAQKNEKDKSISCERDKRHVKATKGRYALSQNLSKLIRQSLNDYSEEKTLKLNWRSREKKIIEERKKMMTMFNETIRKNNYKHAKFKKREEHANLNAKKGLEKASKRRKQEGSNQTDNSEKRQTNPSKKLTDSERRKQIGLQFLGKANTADIKKMLANRRMNRDELRSHYLSENTKAREKSLDEKKSIDEFRKRKHAQLKMKEMLLKRATKMQQEKIFKNKTKLEERAKQIMKCKPKKKNEKTGRSKSSTDLISEEVLRKILLRSDSIPSICETEDVLYKEYKHYLQDKRRNPPECTKISAFPAVTMLPKKRKSKKFETINSYLGRNSNIGILANARYRSSLEIDKIFKKKEKPRLLHKRNRKIQRLKRLRDRKRPKTMPETVAELNNEKSSRKESKRKRRPKKLLKIMQEEEEEILDTQERNMINSEIMQPNISETDYMVDRKVKRDHNYFKSDSPDGPVPVEEEVSKYPQEKKPGQPPKPPQKPSGDKKPNHSKKSNATYNNDKEMEDSLNQSRSAEIKDSDSSVDPHVEEDSEEEHSSSHDLTKLSQKKLDQIVQMISVANSNDHLDEKTKQMLKDFWSKTHKGLEQIANPIIAHSSSNNSKKRIEILKKEEIQKINKKRPKLGLDISEINEEYDKQYNKGSPVAGLPDKPSISGMLLNMERRDSSNFEFLKLEFQKNIEELRKVFPGDHQDTLKEMEEMMSKNQTLSKMFELRENTLNKRIETHSRHIEDNVEIDQKSAARENLTKWIEKEQKILDDEKRKIKKGWFTSIEAINRIKRDLEFTADFHNSSTLKKDDLMLALSKSHASPKSHFSPMISPKALHNAYQKNTMISDPDLRRIQNMKKKEPLKPDKKLIVHANPDFRPCEAKIDSLSNTYKFRESPFASPPAFAAPSENSSNLFNYTPTTYKKHAFGRGSTAFKRSGKKNREQTDSKACVDASPMKALLLHQRHSLDDQFEPRDRDDTDPFDELDDLNDDPFPKDEEEDIPKDAINHPDIKAIIEVSEESHRNEILEDDFSKQKPEVPEVAKSSLIDEDVDNTSSLIAHKIRIPMPTENVIIEDALGGEELYESSYESDDKKRPFEGSLKQRATGLSNLLRDSEHDLEDLHGTASFHNPEGSYEDILNHVDSIDEEHLENIDGDPHFLINQVSESNIREEINFDAASSFTDSQLARFLDHRGLICFRVAEVADETIGFLLEEVISEIVSAFNEDGQIQGFYPDDKKKDTVIEPYVHRPNITSDQITPIIVAERKGIRVNFNSAREYISLLSNFILGTF